MSRAAISLRFAAFPPRSPLLYPTQETPMTADAKDQQQPKKCKQQKSQ